MEIPAFQRALSFDVFNTAGSTSCSQKTQEIPALRKTEERWYYQRITSAYPRAGNSSFPESAYFLVFSYRWYYQRQGKQGTLVLPAFYQRLPQSWKLQHSRECLFFSIFISLVLPALSKNAVNFSGNGNRGRW